MDASKLFAGIALLIELAERGEIDPWDVQVIEVIDRYLSQLVSASSASALAWEAELSQSGQAFLSASMLVLFKAKTLVEMLESPVAADGATEVLLEAEDIQAKPRLLLEHQLHRRPAALPPQKRRVTLKELINQLQLMAAQIQQQEALALTATNPRTRRLSSKTRATDAAREIAQLAHQENLTEVAAGLEQFLNQQPLTTQAQWLNLEDLLELLNHTQRSAAVASVHNNDRVGVFWALLLLSAQSKVELAQEEFYQEIKIRPIPPAPTIGFSNDLKLELTDDFNRNRVK